MMRFVINAVLLGSILSILMFGVQSSDFGETAVLDMARVEADPPAPSTTSAWSALYATGYDEPNPAADASAWYSGGPVFHAPQADWYSAAPADSAANRDEPDRIVAVIAIVLLIGALRLYLSSPRFQKLLYDTFSPLSPLGY